MTTPNPTPAQIEAAVRLEAAINLKDSREVEAAIADAWRNNELIPHDLETGLAAHRDWRDRHPDYCIPPMCQPPDTGAS